MLRKLPSALRQTLDACSSVPAALLPEAPQGSPEIEGGHLSTSTQQSQFGSFRTITTKYPAKCRRCGETIPARTRVRWAKGTGTYQLLSDCKVEATDEKKEAA